MVAIPVPRGRPRIAFVVEQHIGHQTYAQNLRSRVDARDDILASWVSVDYAPTSCWWEKLPASGVRGLLRGRQEVTRGIAGLGQRVSVFNTQVPAVIGPSRARACPYVLCTDVTPIQYDAMASDYGHHADRPGPWRWSKYRWNRHVFRGAAGHAPWSRWVQQSLIDDYGVDAGRIEVIPPGVDTTQWTPGSRDAGPMRILFVGGDFVRKGGDVLLEAFAALPSGSAELRLVTRSTVDRHPGVAVFHGLHPGDPELRRLFQTSDVFVLPSRSETFGIAAIEAGAAGIPVVVSAVGGLSDLVIDGTTGFAIRPGDREDLTRALRRLHDDPTLRRDLGNAARTRAERDFDSSRNADRLVALALRSVD